MVDRAELIEEVARELHEVARRGDLLGVFKKRGRKGPLEIPRLRQALGIETGLVEAKPASEVLEDGLRDAIAQLDERAALREPSDMSLKEAAYRLFNLEATEYAVKKLITGGTGKRGYSYIRDEFFARANLSYLDRSTKRKVIVSIHEHIAENLVRDHLASSVEHATKHIASSRAPQQSVDDHGLAGRTPSITQATPAAGVAEPRLDPVDPPNRHPHRPILLPAAHLLDDKMRDSLRQIATVVQREVDDERRSRELTTHFPLPVRWSMAPDHLFDHWEAIRGERDNAEPMDLAGSLDDVAATFAAVPSGRLVFLGQAGSGKSVIVTELAAALLAARRNDDQPVPVIFHLRSWILQKRATPTGSLKDWMVKQLADNYRVLGWRRRNRIRLAKQLIEGHHIVALLDGFDEISPGLRSKVIPELNFGLSSQDSLVLTSRPDEYVKAVEESNVLSRTAVFIIEDLTLDDLESYLPSTTRKLPDRPTGGTKWTGVLTHLRSSPNDSQSAILRQALTTPLTVSLARSIYSDGVADPDELLDSSRFRSTRAIVGHLLDEYVSVAYRRSAYHPERARKWLGFLGALLIAQDDSAFRWWRMHGKVDYPSIGALATVGFIASLAMLFGARSSNPLTITVGLGGLTLLVALLGGLFALPQKVSMPRDPKRDTGAFRLLMQTLAWIGIVEIFLFTAGSEDLAAVNDAEMSNTELLLGFLVTSLLLSGALVGSNSSIETLGPGDLLRSDIRLAAIRALPTGVGSGMVVWPAWLYGYGHLWPFVVSVAGLIVSGVLLGSASGLWFVRTSWHACSGRLPWRCMRFLEDAHQRRGILRQAGGSFEFRHRLLQERLVTQFIGGASERLRSNYSILRVRRRLVVDRADEIELDEAEAELRDVLAACQRRRFNGQILDTRVRLVELLRHDEDRLDAEMTTLREDPISTRVIRGHSRNYLVWRLHAGLWARYGGLERPGADYLFLLGDEEDIERFNDGSYY